MTRLDDGGRLGEELSASSSLWQRLFIQPVKEQSRAIVVIFLALIFLSLSQTIFLLLIGPLLKSLFTVGANGDSSAWISVSSLVPGGWSRMVPQLEHWRLHRNDLATYIPGLIMAAGITKAIATYFFSYYQQFLSIHMATHYRNELFSSLLGQTFEDISRKSAGKWMSTIMNDVMYLQTRFSAILGGLIKESVLILSSYVVMFVTHWQTALAVVIFSPIFATILGKSGKRISRYAENWQMILAKMSGLILSLRQRFFFVRAQAGELREQSLFEQLNKGYLSMIRASLPIRASLAPVSELVGFVIFGTLIFLVHKDYLMGEKLVGLELVQFFAALALLVKPLKSIGEQVASYHETKGALAQSMDLFSQLDGAHRPVASGEAMSVKGPDLKLKKAKEWPLMPPKGFSIEDLSLSYSGVERFSSKALHFSAGESIAVIGRSGGGKSTFIRFLAGLLPATRASISYQDSGQVSAEELCSHFSFVSQKPFLFEDTLRHNLCYGLSQEQLPSDDRLWQLLDLFSLGDLVRHRASGLDSHLGSIQASLSGGQEQRLTIIRALLRPHWGLLLDEATSALDRASDEVVTSHVLSHAKTFGVVVIFVTHRLHSLDRFDRVLFIEDGEVLFFDEHKKLLAEPRYQSFLQGQL